MGSREGESFISPSAEATDDYARWVLAPTLPEHPIEPESSYFVCGTPRSGSWLLCGLLASTKLAGRPHEYFWRDTEQTASSVWGVAGFAEYLRSVLAAGTTANGVFGAKLMWAYVTEFLERLRELTGVTAVGDGELLAEFFPRPRFVFVSRDDVVAQAVSWARAIQTGYWHAWDPPTSVKPRFDFDQIDALAREVTAHNAQWRRWFAGNQVQALEVRFEDMAAEPGAATRNVLTSLDLDFHEGVSAFVQTTRTGDGLNIAWAARYRSLKGGLSQPV